ncbi:hypothetical protein HOY82DRAFT_572529 [Tuber indicum]|nr:hypothetical protein HOY82DRAFT_572529 [Tuber indicum]
MLAWPFPQGPERTRGLSFFLPSSRHLRPSAAKHHVQKGRGERSKETGRRKKKNDKANFLGRDCAHTPTCIRYLYLTFTSEDVGSLDEWVFSTEAHPFRIMR